MLLEVLLRRLCRMNEDNTKYKCPVCGKEIIIMITTPTDFACRDINCPLGHGARHMEYLISEVYLSILKNKVNIK